MNNQGISKAEILSIGYIEDTASDIFFHKSNNSINLRQNTQKGYDVYILGAEINHAISLNHLKDCTEKYLNEFKHLA
jgi:hypothetical protein